VAVPGSFPRTPGPRRIPYGLRGRLQVDLRRARSAALTALAADMPAAVLAHVLNINTAIGWANYPRTDRSAYLATRIGFSLTLSL
jgi:hypothetical protein